MDETKLCSIAQLQEFLKATPEVSFSGIGEKDGNERYAHISRVLKRFDYPICSRCQKARKKRHTGRARRGSIPNQVSIDSPVLPEEDGLRIHHQKRARIGHASP